MKWGYLFSSILHALFIVFLIKSQHLQNPSDSHLETQAASKINVRTISPQELRKELSKALENTAPKIQIVQGDEQLKLQKNEIKNDTRFLSKSDQKIDFQTRASKIGAFKNVLKMGSKEKISTNDLFILPRNPRDLEQEKSLVSKTGRLRAPASEEAGPLGDGVSQTDDFLEDIAIGTQTLLNTREFIFYSFYDRIRKSLRETWNLRLEAEISRLLAMGATLQFQMNTNVKVTLDSSGQIKDVQIMKSSGIEELDRAAKMAFYDAAPFPNPPQGMIDPSKSVTLRWEFVVVSEPGSPVRVEVKRGI